MDESATRRFQTMIRDRLAALDEEDALGRDGQSTVELDQQAVGRLSRQDALLNQSMAKATQARRDAQRRALVAALARIEDGAFGYCEDCGEEIAIKRLELDPTAMRCISCASG
ncbi:transcriptional regulator, TraR/DksA family [Mameliella alba]|uniref:TraR/DksA family transcriptional regulator n=1 Tax=Mameliella alba TaxID=561184 RepID=UPI000888FF38|nr:TraR/DksA C4-type zinc finger protein [Mameliella alba]OWV49602.1 molecular chaperone DnaK [Mameliella alba]PTR41582.1 TraR/DksA family transcriptional regulator [Mameliella alba]GGF52712.1 molecular chaperone DnaK [Mameliella alba]SDC37434.1 transcriptional regulator, TraR/DksA family [Mameliella alba]